MRRSFIEQEQERSSNEVLALSVYNNVKKQLERAIRKEKEADEKLATYNYYDNGYLEAQQAAQRASYIVSQLQDKMYHAKQSLNTSKTIDEDLDDIASML